MIAHISRLTVLCRFVLHALLHCSQPQSSASPCSLKGESAPAYERLQDARRPWLRLENIYSSRQNPLGLIETPRLWLEKCEKPAQPVIAKDFLLSFEDGFNFGWRKQSVSLLLSHGHNHASGVPKSMLVSASGIVFMFKGQYEM